MPLLTTPNYSITPSSVKQPTKTNYIDIFDYSSQYEPETHDKIANIYGNQSVAGMLYKFKSEGTMSSDKYIWTEEGRLHTNYTDVARAGNVFTKAGHVFRVGETVHLSSGAVKRRGVITAITDNTFTVASYQAAGFTALDTTNVVAFIDGSEFGKGTDKMEGSLSSDVTILDNKPVILKDNFEINGSDVTQISWVSTEDGKYLWFLRDQVYTRRRWEDRMELNMLNAQKAETGADAASIGKLGSEGLFEAIKKRGNVFQGIADSIAEWDTIVKRFDKQGAIADYAFYCDRDASFGVDDLLGTLNAGYDTGISYGIFPNGKEMAINLGFRGFIRGGYEFYKTDAKVLNDITLLGSVNTQAKIRGFLIPMGTKEVYEGEYSGTGMNSKIKKPFLECMYRANEYENRKHKTWLTGSVFGTSTDGEDVAREHHLSERMLNVIGANNFMLFEGTA